MLREGLRPPDPFQERDVLETARTQDGMSLKALIGMGPVLVVCLPERKAAKRMLADIAKRRADLERDGVRIVLVHMEEDVESDLAAHDLQYLARIADPERKLYAHFGLGQRKRILGPPKQEPGIIRL